MGSTPCSSAAEACASLSEWFWNDEVWLPPNVTWEDLKTTPEERYAEFHDLWIPIPAALIVMLMRHFWEKYVFRPLGAHLGLRASRRHRRAPPNAVLEKLFERRNSGEYGKRSAADSNSNDVKGGDRANMALLDKREMDEREDMLRVCRQLNMTERQVDRWLRKRKLQDRPTTLDKFAETGWRFTYYSFIFLFGLVSLWNKPWLWDIRYCWYYYPRHLLDSTTWWYYMVELSFYWSLTISQFYDAKRKDFWEMFVHHMTTIALMAFSWTCNLIRAGTLVLLIHDIADVFLEIAKMCKYANYQRMCDVFFACFAIVWIVTRLGVYPTWILYSTTIEAPQIVEMFPAYYLFNGLLSILLVLHVIWTYFILKIVYKAIYSGKTEKDSRSESSDLTISTSEGDGGGKGDNWSEDAKDGKKKKK